MPYYNVSFPSWEEDQEASFIKAESMDEAVEKALGFQAERLSNILFLKKGFPIIVNSSTSENTVYKGSFSVIYTVGE